MEYVYAALLLHEAGKKVSESSLKKIVKSAGIKPDTARIKALISSLESVDIDKAIEKAAMPVAPAPASEKEEKPTKKEKKEEEKEEKEAAEGLGALFE